MTLRSEAKEELKALIERVERIEAERKQLADDKRSVFAEAKSQGFDLPVMRYIIKRRDKDPTELAEQEAIADVYMHALGMLPENPLHEQIGALARDGMGRDEVIAGLQAFVPHNGEIIARIGGKPFRVWRDEAGRAHAEDYVEPKAARPEKTGRGLGKPAAVLTMVPKDPVKDAADRAERRAKGEQPADEPTNDEPVE